MKTLQDNRLTRTFAELRAAGAKTLLPFITAGFPDLATTEGLLKDFQARGVRVCELGIPFSDPVADGPVIQASYTQALAAGVNLDGIFAMVRRFRDAAPAGASRGDKQAAAPGLALLCMVSYSIVFRRGVAQFLQQASAAGFDGLIIPDLPLEEAAALEPQAAARGLCNVMLIAPTTSPRRRLEIARHSRGFIYYVSVAGITGERTKLPPQTIDAVSELRRHTDTPVCVGFGISNAQTVREVCRVADGAIVGSAIVHRITDAAGKNLPREQLIQQVGQFVSELLSPLANS